MGATAGHNEAFQCLGAETSDAQSHVGRELGDYRLLQLIGEGGMGWVYLARHARIGRRVAIKMLRPELANDPVAVRRFFEEARAVNRIQHDNIVQIHDFVHDDGGATYLVLELLVGQDLLALIDGGSAPLPLSRALGIMVQATQALGEVHACGVVHRDLKPENIFLVDRPGQTDVVKLLDFGIAKLRGAGPASRITRAGTSLGTPDYIAPEQALGADVDHRADVYSFGVILYELVSGRRPFASDDVTLTIARQVTEVPPRPSETRAIPTALDDLVMHCLEKRPSERPQSMVEIEERLRAILASLDRPESIVLELGVDPRVGPEVIAAPHAEEPRAEVMPPAAAQIPRPQLSSLPRRLMLTAGLFVVVVCALALRRPPVDKPASAGAIEATTLPPREDAVTPTAAIPAPTPAVIETPTAPAEPPRATAKRKRSAKVARTPRAQRRDDVLPVYQD